MHFEEWFKIAVLIIKGIKNKCLEILSITKNAYDPNSM